MTKYSSILFPCSFCGKVEGDCEIIIIGPTVNICNECIEVAQSEVTKIRANRNSPFTPPPGEFSGCRCPDCPERNGTGECSCCAERREEDKNFSNDEELSLEDSYLLFGREDEPASRNK